jgi:hypothetical protein
MYPVYARESVRGAHPVCIVTEFERLELLLNGSAKSINNGVAIRLLLTLEQFRGISAQMGPRVTFLAASGSRFHQECAQAYLMAKAGNKKSPRHPQAHPDSLPRFTRDRSFALTTFGGKFGIAA